VLFNVSRFFQGIPDIFLGDSDALFW